MRMKLLLTCLIALSDLTGSAQAELRVPAPFFSTNDAQLIAGNTLLAALVAEDPWLVRRILDLAALHGDRAGYDLEAAAGDDAIEPPQTSSRDAHGAVAWFEVVQQARKEREALKRRHGGGTPVPEADGATNRSATESVALLDMMKKARETKSSR